MRVNVDKVLERDQKLSELDDRADALQAGAAQFETNAAKLKRKYWWKNCKVTRVGGLPQSKSHLPNAGNPLLPQGSLKGREQTLEVPCILYTLTDKLLLSQ